MIVDSLLNFIQTVDNTNRALRLGPVGRGISRAVDTILIIGILGTLCYALTNERIDPEPPVNPTTAPLMQAAGEGLKEFECFPLDTGGQFCIPVDQSNSTGH